MSLVIILAAGCVEGPEPRLICHNANCAGGTDADDDTVAALAASLALRTPDERVVIDGVEIDTVWDRAAQTCRLAHALESGGLQPRVEEACRLIARHLEDNPHQLASHDPAAFVLKIELKTAVTTGGATHTPSEAEHHAACALQIIEDVHAAAIASQNQLEVLIDSNDPRLLQTVFDHPRFPGAFARSPDDPMTITFETNLHTPIPLGLVVGVITASQPDVENIKPSDLALADQRLLVWGRTLTPPHLASILTKHPAFLGANNAAEVRSYLDGRYHR